jgi:hypothetical protein
VDLVHRLGELDVPIWIGCSWISVAETGWRSVRRCPEWTKFTILYRADPPRIGFQWSRRTRCLRWWRLAGPVVELDGKIIDGDSFELALMGTHDVRVGFPEAGQFKN